MDNASRRQWSDARCCRRSRRRDGAAFAVFYRRHLPAVLAFLIRETRDREAAADLAAEVFAAVLLSAGRYTEQGESATPWVIGIARNKLLMSFRRGRVEARARHRLGFQAVALDDADLDRIEEVAHGEGGRLVAWSRTSPRTSASRSARGCLDERPYREIADRAAVLGDGDPQAREPRAGADARAAEGRRRIDVSDYLDRVEAQLTALTESGAHQRLRARRPRWPRRRGQTGPGGPGRRAGEPRRLRSWRRPRSWRPWSRIVLVNAHHSRSKPASNASARRTRVTHSATTSPHAQPTTPPHDTHPAPPGRARPRSPPTSPPSRSPRSASSSGGCSARRRATSSAGIHLAGRSCARPTAASTSSASRARTRRCRPSRLQPGYSQIRFADPTTGSRSAPTCTSPTTAADLAFGQRRRPGQRSRDLRRRGLRDRRRVRQRRRRRPADALAGELEDWTVVPAAGDVSAGLWVEGSDVFVQSGVGNGIGSDVLVSHDGGASFTSYPSPSPGLGCEFQEPEPPVVWAHCATGTESGVWRSTDGGARSTPPSRAAGSALPNSAPFAAASDVDRRGRLPAALPDRRRRPTYTPVRSRRRRRSLERGRVGLSRVHRLRPTGSRSDTWARSLPPTSGCSTRPTRGRATTTSRSREVTSRSRAARPSPIP